jgi:hypothetical protein
MAMITNQPLKIGLWNEIQKYTLPIQNMLYVAIFISHEIRICRQHIFFCFYPTVISSNEFILVEITHITRALSSVIVNL